MPRAQPVYDLVLRGGNLLDPLNGTWSTGHLCIADGVIAAILPISSSFASKAHVDVTGLMVTPGLTDLHVHSYPGETFWGIDTDWPSLASGVTTTIDAGSAGSGNFDGLARILRNSRLKALAFVNIARTGLANPYGELLDASSIDVEGAVNVARAHPDLVVGFKLRASPNTVGKNYLECLAAVRRAGDETGLPVMIHVSDGPPNLETVLAHMRAGDILTHCFTPYENGVVGEGGKPKAVVLEALSRGVLLDVGHGSGSFSFPAVQAWRENEMVLPIISTDLHSRSVLGPAFDMATVMTKFLAVGWDVEEVVAAGTVAPAKTLGRGVRLEVGATADVAVLAVEEGPLGVWDSRGVEVQSLRRLSCKLAAGAGVVRHASAGVRIER